uniref:ABC transporter substrate-binding protein n=1 Tax=Rhizobium sp. RCAM05350 TaxID=2895568 RepID=UPI002076ABE4|nr:ABC transporter substrate-binding protein [Rhizobium sp. RCAM05350]
MQVFLPRSGNSQLSGQQLTKYASSQKFANVAVFHSNDEYGNSGAKDFTKTATDAGLKIALDESFTHGDRDFTGQIGKIVSAAPDAVFLWALGDDLGPVTKQLRQLGYFGPILGPEGYTLPEALSISGSTSDGVVFASQYLVPKTSADATDPAMKTFLDAYEKKFGSMPASDNAFHGYDAVKIIAEGIRSAGSVEGPKVRDAINNIVDPKGIAGTFNFAGKQGEGIDAVRLYQIKDGVYSEIK